MRRSIQNERRVPRVPLRVWATVEHRGLKWRVETQDVGPGGCLVRSDHHLVAGIGVRVVLGGVAMPDDLATDGTVAWFHAPHGGIAFDPRALPFCKGMAPAVWFNKLLAADQRLRMWTARTSAEIDLDAPIFLMSTPRIVDLSPEEALLVSHAEQGISVHELLSRAGRRDQRATHILFGLLEKRVFTTSVGEAGDAWKWRAALADAGHCLPRAGGGPKASPAPIAKVAAPSGAPCLPRAPAAPPRARVPLSEDPPILTTSAVRSRYERSTGTAVTARLLRGVGARQRSPQAEAVFARARTSEAAGSVSGAIELLRQALSLAPQDREISGALARLAFRNPIE